MQGWSVPQKSYKGETLQTAGVGALQLSPDINKLYDDEILQIQLNNLKQIKTHKQYIRLLFLILYFLLVNLFFCGIIIIIRIDSSRIMHNNYDFVFKFIVVGDSSSHFLSLGVGKSCLILRYIESVFKDNHQPTLGVQFASKIIQLESNLLKIQIWDTAGQQSFKAITRSYYKGSIAAFLIFDITSRTSFESLHKWLYQIKNHSHDKVQICLIGNKLDLKQKRLVSFEEAQTFAKNNGFNYLQVSARSGQRVDECFTRMSEKILHRLKSRQIDIEIDSSIGIRRGKRQKKEIISQSGIQIYNTNKGNEGKNCCK